MNIELYRSLTGATRTNLGTQTHHEKLLDSIHCVLGMTSEYLDEYMNATSRINEREELGDLCWYISEYCNIWNIHTPSHYTISTNTDLRVDEIPTLIGKLADLDKAALAYQREIRIEDRSMLVNKLWATVWMLIEGLGFETSDTFSINIKKLLQRYSGKFTAHAANNRDLQKELEILSEGLSEK